jgi:transposase
MKKEAFVGIDVSKSWLDACLVSLSSESPREIRVDNSVPGFKKLVKWLHQWSGSSADSWLVCMEHTGAYCYRLNVFFQEMKISQALVNPLAIKRSMGIVRGKSDRTDARMIAMYAKRFEEALELYQLPSESLQKLKVLLGQRDRLVNVRRQLELAGESISLLSASITKEVVDQNRALQKQLRKSLHELDQAIKDTIKADPELNAKAGQMTTIPGVGLQITAQVLVATQGMKRFRTSRKFACYCGIAPFEHSSGSSFRARTKVHYLANRKIKTMLHLGALSILRTDGELRQYYERKVAEGKNPMSVINAVRFKIIDRIFSVVRRGEAYDPNYSKKAA